jgi:hypothetical protein
MSQLITFENYSPRNQGAEGIYQIGATEEHPEGVAGEISAAFGYTLTPYPDVDNLGGLIGRVGPAKELQENIAAVQSTLGTVEDAVAIARGWAKRSAFLAPVERMYASGEQAKGTIDLAIATGGVRNWMQRRADRLGKLAKERPVGGVLLAAGTRAMKPAEGLDVEEGMTEADYMEGIIVPKLGAYGIAAELLRVDSGVGDVVMAATVARTREIVDLRDSRIAIVSNAGAWVQNGGQYRRAAQAADDRFDASGGQFEVVSDSFQLGTGTEPTATHQNPFSAAGQIVRNLQEFSRNLA